MNSPRLIFTLDVVSRPISIHTTSENAHRKKSGGVKSGDRGGHSLSEMILSQKKKLNFCSAVIGRLNRFTLARRTNTVTNPSAAVTGATDTFLVFHLCFDACVFAQPCFVFSMKLGTCVINFIMLNVSTFLGSKASGIPCTIHGFKPNSPSRRSRDRVVGIATSWTTEGS
jgi:hypothetical protein